MTNDPFLLNWAVQNAYASLNAGKSLYPAIVRDNIKQNYVQGQKRTSLEVNGTIIPTVPDSVVYTITSEPPGIKVVL